MNGVDPWRCGFFYRRGTEDAEMICKHGFLKNNSCSRLAQHGEFSRHRFAVDLVGLRVHGEMDAFAVAVGDLSFTVEIELLHQVQPRCGV
jgi:hypothetical protein